MIRQRFLSALLALYVVLGSWKGYVALFEKGNDEPTQIFPCPVDTLPEDDQRALEEKIPIRSPKALEKALEDYLS